MEMDAIEDNGDEMDEMEAFCCIFGEHQDEESDQDSKEELEVAQAIIEAQTIIPEVFVSALQEKSCRSAHGRVIKDKKFFDDQH